MNTKFLFASLLAVSTTGMALADIVVNLPKECSLETLNYNYAPIKQFAEAKSRADRGLVEEKVHVIDYKAVIPIPQEKDSYMFGLNIDNNPVTLYAIPGETIEINVTSCNPFNYTMKGSLLVDGMNQLNSLMAPLFAKVEELNAKGEPNDEEMNMISQEYNDIQKKYISQNAGNPAASVALMNLDGEDFISVYDTNPSIFNNNILTPLVIRQYEREKKGVEMEKKQQALQSGDIEAPNFTLKDLEGKNISLSDFRGKWVILDFWGSWCPWCIKGFPELKEAYEKYKDNLVIIGVDCNESETEWKAGVEKYELPWVNVYNPSDSSLTSEYGVQGFPTKAIINPDGKIANITVGHNPAFFDVLSNLIEKR